MLLRAIFAVFSERTSHPPDRRPLRAAGCKNGGQGEVNPPGSGAVLRIGPARRGPPLPPQTWRHSRVYHCRDRRVAPCCAVCAQEGANERLRAEDSTGARALWAHYGHTCSEERAATHLTLYGAAGAVRAPHAWSQPCRASSSKNNGSELVNGQALVLVAWTP